MADHDFFGVYAPGGIDLRAVAAPCVGCQYVRGPAAEADVLALHRGLALRHLRDELDTLTAEVRPHAQPLMHDGPRGAVVAPRLHEHRATGPAAVDVRALVGRREDLRHRAGLLIRRPIRGGLGEHRLGQRVDVALLLARAQTTVVALTDRLDRGRQAEDDFLAQAVGAAAAAGVEQPEVEWAAAAVAVVLPPCQRGVPVVERCQAGHRLLR